MLGDQLAIKMAKRRRREAEKNRRSDNWVLRQLSPSTGKAQEIMSSNFLWVQVREEGVCVCKGGGHLKKSDNGNNSADAFNEEVHFLSLWPRCEGTGRTLRRTHPLRLMFH